jgi:FtsZ-interacting cell division protein ZipA
MTWVLLAVVIVLLVVIGLLLARQRRSQQLKQDFGPEYRRAVTEHGDQRAAEKDLAERRRRVEKFEIRPLAPASRERYTERWGAAQRYFVDEPAPAVGEAHALVQEVMRERGYPVEDDFEQRAADVSVDHPNVVSNYRAAHQISLQARGGQASTEELRQAMVHFRALFDDLLTPGDDQHAGEPQAAVERERAIEPEQAEQAAFSDQTTRRG